MKMTDSRTITFTFDECEKMLLLEIMNAAWDLYNDVPYCRVIANTINNIEKCNTTEYSVSMTEAEARMLVTTIKNTGLKADKPYNKNQYLVFYMDLTKAISKYIHAQYNQPRTGMDAA